MNRIQLLLAISTAVGCGSSAPSPLAESPDANATDDASELDAPAFDEGVPDTWTPDDAAVDTGPPACAPGETQACYTGHPGTDALGICKRGVRTCASSGAWGAECVGEVRPTAQDCATTTIDEACDGDPACVNRPLFAALYDNGGLDTAGGFAVAIDKSANVFLTGLYKNAIDFGAGPLTDGGMYLVKLTAAGAVVWQKTFKGGYARSLATDAAGNIVLAGFFDNAIDLGGGPLTTTVHRTLFLAKLDAAGNHVFSKAFVNDYGDPSAAVVATGPSGEVVMTAVFDDAIDLGGGALTSAGETDVFAAKFDAAGKHLWSKRFGGSGHDEPGGAAIGANGEVVLTGWFRGAVDFGGGVLTATRADAYLVGLDASGGHVWSKVVGGAGNQLPTGLALDSTGNVFLSGLASGSIDFGDGQPKTAAPATWFCFVAKYSAQGTNAWANVHHCASNPYVVIGPRVATDTAGAVVAAGLTRDAYAIKFDAGGVVKWARSFGSKEDIDWTYDVAIDPSGNTWVTGNGSGSMDFGGGLVTSRAGNDTFLVQFPP